VGANVEGMPMCMWERAAERKKRLGVRRQWVVAHRVRVPAPEDAQCATRRAAIAAAVTTAASIAAAAATAATTAAATAASIAAAASTTAATLSEEGAHPRRLRVARLPNEHDLDARAEHLAWTGRGRRRGRRCRVAVRAAWGGAGRLSQRRRVERDVVRVA